MKKTQIKNENHKVKMNRTFLKRKTRSDLYLYGSLMIEKWKILTQIFTFPIQRMKENEKENKKEKEIEVVVYCWSHCLHLWLLSSHQKSLIRKKKELVAATSIEYVLELSPLRMKEKQWEKGKREVKYKIRKKERENKREKWWKEKEKENEEREPCWACWGVMAPPSPHCMGHSTPLYSNPSSTWQRWGCADNQRSTTWRAPEDRTQRPNHITCDGTEHSVHSIPMSICMTPINTDITLREL